MKCKDIHEVGQNQIYISSNIPIRTLKKSWLHGMEAELKRGGNNQIILLIILQRKPEIILLLRPIF